MATVCVSIASNVFDQISTSQARSGCAAITRNYGSSVSIRCRKPIDAFLFAGSRVECVFARRSCCQILVAEVPRKCDSLGKPATFIRAHASATEVMAQMSDTGNVAAEVVRVNMFDLDSNYGWLIRDNSTGKVAAIDPAQPDAIQQALEAKSWSLDYILNTHHHHDHVGGNSDLKSVYGCTIVGFSGDAERIPLMDVGVTEGDTVQVGSLAFKVFEVPGHTRGHIAYWAESAAALFPGDTLFAMGCGRLFEGTPEQMWNSLKKLRALPGNTSVYCAHEYTQNNARWAVTVEPENKDLADRKQQVDLMRSQGTPTIPTTISDELKTNPFLRPDSSCIRNTLGVASDASDETAFASIRRHKDSF